ncbi:hypothetical protein ACS0TY_013132 [Phlomoides rotata]
MHLRTHTFILYRNEETNSIWQKAENNWRQQIMADVQGYGLEGFHHRCSSGGNVCECWSRVTYLTGKFHGCGGRECQRRTISLYFGISVEREEQGVLPHESTKFKFLDKAILAPNRAEDRNVCTIDDVNDAKAILRLAPIWCSCLGYAIVLSPNKLLRWIVSLVMASKS